MAMSRKHYRELASMVATFRDDGPTVDLDVLTSRLVTFFADDNPRFSPTQFRAACAPKNGDDK